MRRTILLSACLIALLLPSLAPAAELTVGPGKAFATPAEALAKASPGDTILVYPRDKNAPYEKVALMLRKERITIKAVIDKPDQRVPFSGEGFVYTGDGPVPRAIVQFDPQAGGCVLEGFELRDAHNADSNGAGVRINQANNVTVRNCHIHACDMGIMSNGNATDKAAVNQRIESCLIHSNGNAKDPGQNHNLYLGGTSVTLSACEVHSSLTGHNVKSRAHFTRVEYCYIHDSANREFDLVDGKGDTTIPGSDAVVLGNIIVKAAKGDGNHTVIHFGADGGNEHDGTVYVVHNTIVTPYISPVVDLSAPKAKARFVNNIIWDAGSGQNNQQICRVGKGEKAGRVDGSFNWLSAGFKIIDGGSLDSTYQAKGGENPPFVNPAKGDYHLKTAAPTIVGVGLPWPRVLLPTTPGAEPPTSPQPGARRPEPLREYVSPLNTRERPGFTADAKADLGAFGWESPEKRN